MVFPPTGVAAQDVIEWLVISGFAVGTVAVLQVEIVSGFTYHFTIQYTLPGQHRRSRQPNC